MVYTRPAVKHDLRLEVKFTQQIKGILGMCFIQKDVNADLHEATDFLIFDIKPIKVAARLRTFYYYEHYPNEFTLRWSRPSGVPTEIDKVREGLVDYLFYGFVDETETSIIKYFIGDFRVFRDCGRLPIAIKPNNPPDSELAAWRVNQFPRQFIIKEYAKLN